MSERSQNFDLLFFKRFFKLLPWLFPSWKSVTVLLFVLLLCLGLLEQFVIYNLGLVPSKYYKVLGNKDHTGFWEQTGTAIALILAEAFIKSSTTFLTGLLYLKWRDTISRRLHSKYFTEVLYYTINVLDKSIDNPDQRITQDVNKLCDTLSQISAPLIISPFKIGYYIYKSQQSTGYIGPVGVLVFFIIATVINKLLMSPVVTYVFRKEKMEGNFRFKHMQMRSNSESAAFYRSGHIEQEKTNQHLDQLITTQKQLIYRQYALNFSVNLFDYLGSILSYIALAFPIFLGSYDSLSPTDLSALISANAFVMIYLINCFTTLIDLSAQVTVIAGTTHRVVELHEVLDRLREAQHSREASRPSDLKGFGWSEMERMISHDDSCQDDDGQGQPRSGAPLSTAFYVSDLTYTAPRSSEKLCEGLSFKFERGVNILVTGDSGCGKSSLLRVINGIWPEVRGLVEYEGIMKPHTILFLPQRPYLTDGSLLQQIVFPLNAFDKHVFRENDDIMHDLLHKTDLSHLTKRVNGLETVVNWNWYDHLSPGEMQRLSFVRLFYHKPAFAVLDEATSQVPLDMEHRLYTMCREMGITVLSVGHRGSLRRYHQIELQFTGNGAWNIKPIVDTTGSSGNRTGTAEQNSMSQPS